MDKVGQAEDEGKDLVGKLVAYFISRSRGGPTFVFGIVVPCFVRDGIGYNIYWYDNNEYGYWNSLEIQRGCLGSHTEYLKDVLKMIRP